ncbi:eukaryotic translation initiation factor 4 gamma 1-like [Symsagittifera roscoffensis]|uniref:eukaryotic translation initiation factor 4 gamma 1-like n=1 Tax=Symsagittifera roscoffensis TaxID=84072 RepID=UPI00307B9349
MNNSSDHIWKPKRKQDATEVQTKHETVRRKTMSILNRLTPENFFSLSQEMTSLDIDSDDLLDDVIEIWHSKACTEPHYAEMYATLFSQHFSNGSSHDPNSVLARKSMLNRCQNEFNKEMVSEVEQEALKLLIKSNQTCKNKKHEAHHCLDDIRRSKQKYLGNICFIGELFKLDLLTPKIMHSIIETLLNTHDEFSFECASRLLSIVGHKLDHDLTSLLMDQYFHRVLEIMFLDTTSKRIRFMLQDVIELRQNDWEPRRLTGPKTIEEVHYEAQLEDFYLRERAENLGYHF